MTEASKEANSKAPKRSKLQRVLCIHYPIQFNRFFIKTLIDSDSKINAMQLSFTRKLGFHICKTNMDPQKIDSSRLETFGIVIVLFQMDDNDGKFCFFNETSLLADINIDVAFEILFFS